MSSETRGKRKVAEKWIPTYCNQCNMGPDPIRVLVKDGVAVKVEGNSNLAQFHPGYGRCCVKAKGLTQKLYNPNRVKAPMKRTNPRKGENEDPGWQEISWNEALDIFAQKLREVRAKGLRDELGLPRVAIMMGADGTPPAFNGTWLPFWLAWGPTDGSLGGGGGVKCYHAEHLYGEMWHRSFTCGGDMDFNRYQLVFGRNYNASNGVTGLRRQADARGRGMKTIQFEPHLSVTGATADEWVPIKPKTDSAFLFSMLNVVLHEIGAWDAKFLKERSNSPYLVGPDGYYVRDAGSKKPLIWDPVDEKAKPYDSQDIKDFALEGAYKVSGVEVLPEGKEQKVEVEAKPSFQLLKDHMQKYTPEWAADICDVPAATIRRIAREYIDNAQIGATMEVEGVVLPFRPVTIDLGKTVNNGFGAYQCVWASHVLSILVGALDVPGGHISFGPLMLGPIEPGPDGFLSFPANPSDKEHWQWPPATRDGFTTLTPLAVKIAMMGDLGLGAMHLSWLNMVDPPANWPKASFPDILVIHKSNPVISSWDTPLVKKCMEKIPFCVSFAYTTDETNWYADLLLPENIDLEGLQLFPMGGVTFCYGQKWQYSGFHIRQPVVKPVFNTMDMTNIFTELASRVGILKEYYEAIARIFQLSDEYKLKPSKKYTVEDIYDNVAKSGSGGMADLNFFKENGGFFMPMPKLAWYKLAEMMRLGLRYELPYEERIKRIGAELEARLHEKGIHWWQRQNEEYKALPECEDFSKLFESEPQYDMWLITMRSMQFYWGGNVDVPWMIEAALELIDHGGVVMNTKAAEARGIKHGDEVWVESPLGRVKAKALVRQGIRPDTILMVQQFGHNRTPIARDLGWPNMNPLTPISYARTDETGSGADLVKVKVYKAGR